MALSLEREFYCFASDGSFDDRYTLTEIFYKIMGNKEPLEAHDFGGSTWACLNTIEANMMNNRGGYLMPVGMPYKNLMEQWLHLFIMPILEDGETITDKHRERANKEITKALTT